MARRSLSYRKLKSLEDTRKLEYLTALGERTQRAIPDITAEIPATVPEKMVYNYLFRLGIRFAFQYHEENLESTAYPEEIWIPDFILEDYNTRIQVFGTYWHSLPNRRASDLRQIAVNLYAGRMAIEHGVQLFPESGGFTGKYIIWWENEIYMNLGFLFARDLPELFSKDRITGTPDENILDYEKQRERMKSLRAAMTAEKIKPKLEPITRQHRKIRSRVLNLEKVNPFAQSRKEQLAALKLPKILKKPKPRRYRMPIKTYG